MKISSILKQKRTWSIMLFYVLAVLIRVVSTRFETIDPSHVKLWDFVGGLSPLIGAIVVILALRRKMKTSLFGTSVTKSILTLAVPFVLFGIVDYKEIGLCLWLLFVYLLYAFFEEVGWRGYLYSELIGCKIIHRLLLTTLLWFFWHCRAWQIGDVCFFALLFLASFWSLHAYPWYAFSYTGGLLPWSVQFLFQMPLRPKPLVVNRLSRHHHHAVALHLVWAKSQDLLEIM